ncbi:hypothetical protein AG1IA_05461 [Rhizoctonia solani AG-1 IA]|uniref:Uncharacterized protein n=1 Tax=Thanatephorus cucumeris (strain AG1-IA) TaxID=983506 RepID=L8WQT8_THACA|nr:hypothetical protein AG1IA_05461 [Rhizoctonia solani AG-1 IA]
MAPIALQNIQGMQGPHLPRTFSMNIGKTTKSLLVLNPCCALWTLTTRIRTLTPMRAHCHQ